MRIEPKGYWSRVFHQATALINAKRELSGDAAYWMARRLVDEDLENNFFHAPHVGSPGDSASLVLAP